MNDGEADNLTQRQHREDESDSTHETEPLLAINEMEEESSTRSTNILTTEEVEKPDGGLRPETSHREVIRNLIEVLLIVGFCLGLCKWPFLPTLYSISRGQYYVLFGILIIFGMVIPMLFTYYIGGALLKKANGDVGKNVVIGGGLLGGGLIGGVYWIFMGKNIPGTHLGVLLGIAINRGTVLRILVVLLVGAAYFYAVSPPYFYGVPLEYMNNTTNQLSLFEYIANNPQPHLKGLFDIGKSEILAI